MTACVVPRWAARWGPLSALAMSGRALSLPGREGPRIPWLGWGSAAVSPKHRRPPEGTRAGSQRRGAAGDLSQRRRTGGDRKVRPTHRTFRGRGHPQSHPSPKNGELRGREEFEVTQQGKVAKTAGVGLGHHRTHRPFFCRFGKLFFSSISPSFLRGGYLPPARWWNFSLFCFLRQGLTL